jgi:hypothetical protein
MGAFNGAGVFQRSYNWADDKAAAIKIRADRMDTEMDGFAAGLSNCICRDGQSTITASLPMNSNKLTGLAAGSSAGDSVRYEQVALLSAGASQTITRSAAGDVLVLQSTDAGATLGPVLSLFRNSASPSGPSDLGGAINFDFNDDAGNRTTMAAIAARLTDPVNGSEDGTLLFRVITAGSYADKLAMTGASLYAAVNDGIALGASGFAFSDLFLASGAVVNFDAGNYTLTHSAGLLTANGNLSVNGTSGVLSAGTIELGHASDTTLSRSASGKVAVEGVDLIRNNTTDANLLMAGMAATLTSSDRVVIYDDSAGTFHTQTIGNFLNQAFNAYFGSTKGMIIKRNTSSWDALSPP